MPDIEEADIQQMRDFAEKYADIKGFALNPNEEELEMVLEGLAHARNEYDKQYCPCRPVTGDQEEDKPKICPCKWHEQEIEEDGHCHCALFFDPEAAEEYAQ